MKVLQVLPALDSGGVERGTLEIARALVAADHESWVVSAGGRLVSRLRRQGSQHIEWDLGRKNPLTLRHVPALRRWLRESAFDVVHLRSRMPAWLVWLAWRGMDPATRPRLVSTVHGLHSVSRYSAIVTCGERVIVVSDAVRRYVLDNYPQCDARKLRLIHRGIDPGAFPLGYRPHDEWLRHWYQAHPQLLDARVLTLAGRLTRLKGHHDFFTIVRLLRERGEPVHGLVVGGEDPKRMAYARELYAAVRDQGLAAHITFCGQRDDLRDIYAVSDAVLSLSTRPESFGRTVLEPLALGVPVVGYAHGGVAEILQALYPEGAVDVGDHDSAATRLQAVLAGDAGAPRENTRFILSRMCEDTLALYAELVASPRPQQ
jgi:glycosyltransferase involved in cell wall biosynthesis